jgi:hypothetical protein
MVFQNQEELQAYAEWAKEQINGMADHIRSSDLFHDEIMGHAVWTLPHQLFIGKAWSKSDKTKSYWIISGEQVPTDHIGFSVAATAREAAKHFTMKWQMQSVRLERLGDGAGEGTGEPSDDVDWLKVASGLQAQAEALYGLVENEEAWKLTEEPLIDPGSEPESTT